MHPLVVKAKSFAIAAHESIGQRYGELSYSVHLVGVHNLLLTVSARPALLAAAWLHDVLEDVRSVTRTELEMRFGPEVADLVNEVTDVSVRGVGTRAERKELDRLHLRDASPDGKTLKLADVICNLRGAGHLDRKFAEVYIREKALVLPMLVGGNEELLRLAHRTLESAASLLEINIDKGAVCG
jgi:(p)ppGpp synthase/HD superfamily hydrolase